MEKQIHLAGRTWTLTRASVDEQFEIECILLRVAGPALAVGVGTLVEALATEIVTFLADVTDATGSFDLSRLGDIDTRDERVRGLWTKMLAELPGIGSAVLSDAMPVLLRGLDHADILRLMQLTVLGKALVEFNGSLQRVVDFKTLGMLLSTSPADKWTIMVEAIRFNYADGFAAAVGATE